MPNVSPEKIEGLASQFRWFAKAKCKNSSLLYEVLGLRIAEDRELLALAAFANEPIPNILLGAVHFLLLKGTQSPLALFYPSISSQVPPGPDPYPLFRSFCFDHKDEIQKIISTRFVQTNEVRRCSYLFPAFCLISDLVSGRELSILEVGTSAGLNLILDHYCYNYGGKRNYGALRSPICIKTVLRGNKIPNTDDKLLKITRRIGLDLNTIDKRDPEEILWLRALIWPEHRERVDLLLKAIDMAKNVPMILEKGDAIEMLPEILPSIPEDTALCIFHMHTVNQFSRNAKKSFYSIISECGSHRDLFHLSCEWGKQHPQLEIVAFQNGARTQRLLAYCDLHGRWIEWLYS